MHKQRKSIKVVPLVVDPNTMQGTFTGFNGKYIVLGATGDGGASWTYGMENISDPNTNVGRFADTTLQGLPAADRIREYRENTWYPAMLRTSTSSNVLYNPNLKEIMIMEVHTEEGERADEEENH